MRQYLFLAAALILSACGDKYPYPPQFASPDDVPPTVLAGPLVPGTPAQEKEIQSITSRQANLTDKQKAAIHSEDHISPAMIVEPVLGKRYSEANYPALYQLLRHAGSDAWRICDAAQDYWKSPRPWVADSRVKLLVPSITRPGYPSGHTTTNMVWAHILGDLFPAKRQAFIDRAMQIGAHRIEGGAHYPHDVKHGRKLAGLIHQDMKTDPKYQDEFAAANAEIRKANAPIPAIKLPATPIAKAISSN